MPRHQVTFRAAAQARYDAMQHGSDAANYAADCEEPHVIELRGVGPLLMRQLATVKDDPFVDWYDTPTGPQWVPHREPDAPKPPRVLTGYAKVRCRKCSRCLHYKKRLWTAKAISEVRQSHRTWFGTLTINPDRRVWAKSVAAKACLQRRAEHWSSLNDHDRTVAIAGVLQPEVTRWLKRVRKESRTTFRYLLVVEPHKDGFPHFHMLLHETGTAVVKRLLEAQWKYGFSKWNLIDPASIKEARYICKYIVKSAQTRLRASQHYGQLREELGTEALKLTRTVSEEINRLSQAKDREQSSSGEGGPSGGTERGRATF